MTLEELLKAQGIEDAKISAVLTSMKENKIYTASEENLDIRYNKLAIILKRFNRSVNLALKFLIAYAAEVPIYQRPISQRVAASDGRILCNPLAQTLYSSWAHVLWQGDLHKTCQVPV